MITLNDLTPAQVAMCERVWACKEKQDFTQLVNQLTEEDRRMAVTLMEIMIQETYEEELELLERYPDAEAMLDRLKKDYL
jgi:flagellar biosynthesis/type III secretory pathway chaperone